MFEEVAEEYVIKKHNIDITKQPVDFSLRCEFAEDFTDFQKGAEFGYNKAKVEVEDSYRESLCNSELNLASVTEQLEELEKANEWHYVKDGDLPKDEKEYLVLFCYKNKDKIRFTCGIRDNLQYDFEIHRTYTEQIIAWKEIVLPKEKE